MRFLTHTAAPPVREADSELFPMLSPCVTDRRLDPVAGNYIASGMAEREVYHRVHAPNLDAGALLADVRHIAHCDIAALSHLLVNMWVVEVVVVGQGQVALHLSAAPVGYKLHRAGALHAVAGYWVAELDRSNSGAGSVDRATPMGQVEWPYVMACPSIVMKMIRSARMRRIWMRQKEAVVRRFPIPTQIARDEWVVRESIVYQEYERVERLNVPKKTRVEQVL
jgi:hypothetical protein